VRKAIRIFFPSDYLEREHTIRIKTWSMEYCFTALAKLTRRIYTMTIAVESVFSVGFRSLIALSSCALGKSLFFILFLARIDTSTSPYLERRHY